MAYEIREVNMSTDIELWLSRFIMHCQIERGLSENTIVTYKFHLQKFKARINETQVSLQSIDSIWMQEYSQFLSKFLNKFSVASHCAAVRQFYKFYCLENDLAVNPAEEGLSGFSKLSLPLPPSHSVKDLNALISQPNRTQMAGLRDAVMMEMAWLTGLRVTELITLKKMDIIPGEFPYLKIIGKGNKQRNLYMPTSWFQSTFADYLSTAHSLVSNYDKSEYVFVSNRLKPMSRQNFWMRIKKYGEMARIHKFSPHDLRHAFAYHTLMAAETDSNEALVVLKMALGHESITTTQRYLGITNKDVQNEYQTAHPRSV